MFKTIALLKTKPGLSREAFIDYYESTHVPLIRQCLPQIDGYRRNFVRWEGAVIAADTTADFDVVTEMWYADRAAFEAAMALFAQPEVSRRIAEDEEHFLDRSKTRFFMVEECTEASSGPSG